ncbi:hypothetical protein [Streptomyces sp. NPDC056661]|uniref:hypothetical protein n=1 Tax=Streptomyces sp. NPDC056661 TaxID=3345898 RepID=UPI0036A4FE09
MNSRSRGLIVAALLTGALATLAACTGKDSPAAASSAAPATTTGRAASSPGPREAAGAGTPTARQAAPQSSAAAAGGTSSCHSLAASPALKDEVTGAYMEEFSVLRHIKPTPGTFYYGQCGTTRYAGTTFMLTKGYTEKEAVNMQDDGTTMKYFSVVPGGPWSFIASGAEELAKGCSAVKKIPAQMARAWGDCPAGKAG